MTTCPAMAFLPETVLLLGALGVFVATLRDGWHRWARVIALGTAAGAIAATVVAFGQQATLFNGTYRVDAFSQLVKLIVGVGFLLVLILGGRLRDIEEETRPEFHLFLTLGVGGLFMLVSSVDLITLVVALEVASYPLYLLVPMRRERTGQRMQMESAIKYLMFGVAANGLMLFGMSYLFGLTGTTFLPDLMPALAPQVHTPMAITGLALTFCGMYYKLAVFPFQFWTPDVYEGASHETTAIIASLPKVAVAAVLVRFVSLATAEHEVVAQMLTVLALASMFYGNLIALVQKDIKRLLGFSGIAHGGYALVGFVAMDGRGFSAAVFYMTAYLFMVLAAFTVVSRVSREGENVASEDLAGLHRRSPLLALTLVAGVFGLAGIPPFAGFTGKLALLTAALAKGHLMLVVFTMVNAAIAVYYYLGLIRDAFFRESDESAPPIVLDPATRLLCVALILAILFLGVAPAPVFDALAAALP